MQLIDIGVNLTHPSLAGDAAGVLERARAAGVVQMILTGTDLADSRLAANLVRQLDAGGHCLFSTAGVHPHHASEWNAGVAAELAELLGQAAGIGGGANAAWISTVTSRRGRCRRKPWKNSWNWPFAYNCRCSCMSARPANACWPFCARSAIA